MATTLSEALATAIQHHQSGHFDAAEQIYRQILAADPNHANATHLLGVIALQSGQHALAVEHITRAIELNPTDSDFHSNLGLAFQAQGNLDSATASFRRAIELKPESAAAHSNLGNALTDQGKLDEAVACCRKALELKPDLSDAHNNLGNVCMEQGQLDEAVASYRRALELKPEYAEVYSSLGNALRAQGNLDEAVIMYRRAVELKPEYTAAHNNLGNVLQIQGHVEPGIACYRRALELNPQYAEARDNLLLALQYRAGVTLPELAAAHAEYDRLHAAPLRASWRPHENDRDPNRPIRVGFVSPDFGQHPIGFFLIRMLECLDRGRCESVCYNDRKTKDDLTMRFESAATVWREVSGQSDAELAAKIRADRIDILFDLAGHTAKNRLLVFAQKPAPIQVTWAGYAGTTGLTAMDYILADRYEIPPDAETNYCERVLRMPDGYVCYEPPLYAPSVSPLPALKNGLVTFGSFNNRPKITPQVIDVWAQILNRVPQSRLMLKYRGMNSPSIANNIANDFANRRIDPRRVECLGTSAHHALLEEYNHIDLALDPFPYNGGLTTCEALWMGVPVITCPGETFASRHSLSHLSNVGLTETIARDFDEYADLAVSLATDLPRLSSLRASLRAQLAASPLCDGKRFAENLMHILCEIWCQWCQEAGR